MQTLATLRHFYATRDTPTFAPIEIGEKQVTLVEGIVDTETSVALLDQFSIIHADQQLCHTVEEALLWAESRYPIVLKVPNEILAHKTEMKGVFTNLKTNEALAAAWQTLTATVQSLTNKPLVLLVQKQISFEEELFIGGNRDGASSVYESNNEGFGHLLVFGKGGISTEIFKDFGYALVPAPQETLLNALASTKISSILVGFRNRPALAVGKFVQLLQKVQRLLVTYPEIVSIDFNPVLITETEVFAVDVKIFVQK
jgi:acyl-CoA synthetase (NDP forming)